MRYFIFAVLLSAACLAGPVRAADTIATHEADVRAIRAVVEQFQAAIIAHDGNAIGSLFLQEHDSWLSLPDAPLWKDVRARNPAATRVIVGSWRKFADFVAHSTVPIEERFYNVRIDTNGTVGSVYFDFEFLMDGKVSNRGSETWQVMQGDDGWKITSMLYSNGR